jgi:hypothetical protein
MLLPHADGECRWVLRLWRSELRLQPDDQRLWIGNVGLMALREHWQLVRVWHFLDEGDAGITLLQPQLQGWRMQLRERAASDRVLLLQPPAVQR